MVNCLFYSHRSERRNQDWVIKFCFPQLLYWVKLGHKARKKTADGSGGLGFKWSTLERTIVTLGRLQRTVTAQRLGVLGWCRRRVESVCRGLPAIRGLGEVEFGDNDRVYLLLKRVLNQLRTIIKLQIYNLL